MAKLYNAALMTTATTGTGTVTLGSAVTSFLTFAQAGVQDGETVSYVIEDGSNREVGRGVYTASGTTLTRSVLRSTNSNSAINLSGSARVGITAAAEDLGRSTTFSVFTTSGTFTTPANSTPHTVYKYTIVGAGGGGGGSNGLYSSAGGGGGGAVVIGTFTGVSPNTGITITIGSGGAGGSSSGGNGGNGGSSSIGTPVSKTANGGTGALGVAGGGSAAASAGGAGGTASGGTININGTKGMDGASTGTTVFAGNGGVGGSGPYGGGGSGGGGYSSAAGYNGGGYGSGGGGGVANTGAGGSGAGGLVIIEYLS